MPTVTLQEAVEIAVQHHRQGRLAEAEQLYRKILAAKPDHAEALHFLGIVAAQTGHPEQAIELIGRAIALEPNPTFYRNLGNVYRDINDADKAIACYQRATELIPNDPQARLDLATSLLGKKHYDQALVHLQQVIQMKPDYYEAYSNLAVAFDGMGQLEQAKEAALRAVQIQPNYFQGYTNWGLLLAKCKDYQGAIAAFQKVIALQPDDPRAYSNMATALERLGRWDESIEAWERAVQIKPDFAEAQICLAVALENQGQWDRAEAAARASLRADPESFRAHWDLGLILLRRGRFAEGWEQYEWRTHKSSPYTVSGFDRPKWTGQPISGKTLLLHYEQGYGDTIQFVRYIPSIVAAGTKVSLICQPAQFRLFAESFGDIAQVTDGSVGSFDFHCPLPSLPGALHTDLKSILRNVPYLRAPSEAIEKWERKLAGDEGKLRVGLTWAGSPENGNDFQRSIPLSLLSPLSKFAVSWHSLQKGPRAGDTFDGWQVWDHSQDLTDFAETAALIHHMDLVITVDTSVAHLSGALGKPAWLPLPFCPDWRWLLDRDDSPWYPTIRLFRQKTRGDWLPVIERIAVALREGVEKGF